MSFVSPGSTPGGALTDGSVHAPSSARFVPHLIVRTEPLVVNEGTTLAPVFREVDAPVLELAFQYADATNPDLDGERRARFVLESFGALEIGCLETVEPLPGSRADYVLRPDAGAHAFCSFSAYALPQLRSFGWRVEVAPDYPYQVIEADAPWYAETHADDERPDWLGVELGIEVEGKRVNLLPALLELIEGLPPSSGLGALVPPGARCFALPLGDRKYLALPPERLRIVIDVLREVYEGDDAGRIGLPAARAGALLGLEEAFPPSGAARLIWCGEEVLRARARARISDATPAEVADCGPPKGLQATLRPYQEEGVRWMQRLVASGAGGVLADDMGLGKTLQTIAHILAEKEHGRLDKPALVITPTSLLPNWKKEIAKFAPQLRVLAVTGSNRRWLWSRADRHDVVLTTYPLLVRDEEIARAREFHLVILDEAQAIKNARSQAHKAVSAMNGRHRLCLSGTPVENNLGELWSLFEFASPGLLGDEDWFRHRYRTPIERFGDHNRLRTLRNEVAPYILRRTKEEVAPELPGKTEIVRPVDLRGEQRDLYESLRVAAHAEVRRAISARGLGASAITILDALMRLRQVCCDPRLLPSRVARNVRQSAKFDLLMELLGQQLGHGRRVLVFSQFASMLALIGNGLDGRGVRHVTLTGATGDRARPVESFEQKDADVFLISLKAGGTGLNLVSADTVIHYDPWWNPAAQAQATDRAHRIGQKRPVFVYNLIVAGSVEERMLKLQQKKRALADGLLAREPTGAGSLTEGEVEELFAPLPEG